jgi:hypothetical protein
VKALKKGASQPSFGPYVEANPGYKSTISTMTRVPGVEPGA